MVILLLLYLEELVQVQREQAVLQDPLVHLVKVELLELLDHLELVVVLEPLVLAEHQDPLARQEHPVLTVHQERQDRTEPLVKMETDIKLPLQIPLPLEHLVELQGEQD